MAKSRILLISVIPSDFSKLMTLALMLQENGFEVEFFFEERAHSLGSSINKAKEMGFLCHHKKKTQKRK